MSVDMIAPEWMHSQITAAEYESWSEEQCAGIEIVDGMIVVSPRASKRHNRLARILATPSMLRPDRAGTPTPTLMSGCRTYR